MYIEVDGSEYEILFSSNWFGQNAFMTYANETERQKSAKRERYVTTCTILDHQTHRAYAGSAVQNPDDKHSHLAARKVAVRRAIREITDQRWYEGKHCGDGTGFRRKMFAAYRLKERGFHGKDLPGGETEEKKVDQVTE